MNIDAKLAKALRELLERGNFDDDGDFCLYATESERALQEESDDNLGIEEVVNAYAVLREWEARRKPVNIGKFNNLGYNEDA